MIRRTGPLLVVLAVLVALAGCSSSDGSSASGGDDTTSTTDFATGQKASNLETFARDIEARNASSIAVDTASPAGRWASFLDEYDNTAPLTFREVEPNWQVCGVGQTDGGCATLSDFTFDGTNRVNGFAYEGQPISDLVRGPGPLAEINSGSIAGVTFREAFLNPKDRRLYVAMSVLWNPEVAPDTTGCDPTKATYSQGGPVADPKGGGEGDDLFSTWLMTMSFPDASFGGELKVSCYRKDGASETFTFTIA
ncbi:hypothetical protein KSP35_03945 [Aquihabitans sp. G128]|uniref:hypothetical protein n=1 Tax=Aquihabitans sp. G128 TaxID=2849779 RepID=UPI001C25086F|nr:hypothetical protein [Aquihabitans sp. G128]QXC61982.1 hypothetical protein KSP35_03945 [Aquihabitans sp. G128]